MLKCLPISSTKYASRTTGDALPFARRRLSWNRGQAWGLLSLTFRPRRRWRAYLTCRVWDVGNIPGLQRARCGLADGRFPCYNGHPYEAVLKERSVMSSPPGRMPCLYGYPYPHG